jgi:hypothetical protein
LQCEIARVADAERERAERYGRQDWSHEVIGVFRKSSNAKSMQQA